MANNRIGVGEIERVVLWWLEHMGLRRRAHMTCLVTGRGREGMQGDDSILSVVDLLG